MLEVTITGIPHLLNTLRMIPQNLNMAIAEGFAELGQSMVNDMQGQAPVDTGYLQSSIAVNEASSELLKVECGADYGIYNEFGTYKMTAQPFFFPVVDQYKGQIGQIIQRHLII